MTALPTKCSGMSPSRHGFDLSLGNLTASLPVHGLGGHWKLTWTADSNKNWLEDFLPLQLQDAGINESDTAFNKAATSIDDIAGILLHPQISNIG